MSGLVAQGLTFQYSEDSAPILRDFSLSVPKGSTFLITGASGCGKSTLCSVLAGIYPRHGGVLKSGRVCCDGEDIHAASISRRAQLMGMMFQNPDLQFCMDTVENELVFCLENICVPPQEIPRRVEESLALCAIEDLRARKLHTLSGGEKQKVMLACITALGSGTILLDEPFANIDPQSSAQLCRQLRMMQQEKGTTLLVVDHQVANFLAYADEMLVLGKEGRILQRSARKGATATGTSLPDRASSRPADPAKATPRQPVFSLHDVRAGYDDADILRGVTATFNRACMTAITGKSGSGKSTLLSVLSRMNRYRGSVLMEGREISRIARMQYAGAVGIVFQNPQDQFVANTVYEEIAVSLRGKCAQADVPQRVRSHLEELDLWEYRNFSPYMLSQGQQRRLAVGALLAFECKVLLCDEPTYGQDGRSIESVMGFLQRRVRQDGLTVIFSTHNLSLAETYADDHYRFENGTVRSCADLQEVAPC